MDMVSTLARPAPAGFPAGPVFDADGSTYRRDRSGRTGAEPLGVARIASIDDLDRVIRWANRSRTPLVPVSSAGGPRRRGDTIASDPALIVDLSAMNRVIHVDDRDAVAVIEAGVTFAGLAAALAPHGLRPFTPLLPRASKSVLAAFLEREPVTTPGQHWDAADPLGGLELVFGNGDRFRTGGAALPGTIEENLARGNRQLLDSGPGQTDFGRVVQGAQGALAIVARGAVLCRRVPARSEAWFASADTLAPVVRTAYAMLRKRPDGHLFIVNAAQLALMLAADADGIAALRARLPAWTLFVELSAPEAFAEEAMAYRRADLTTAAEGAGASLHRAIGGQDADALAAMLDRPAEAWYKDHEGGAHDELFFLTQLDRVAAQLAAIGDIADVAVYLQPVAQGVSAHCELTFLAGDQPAATRRARQAAEHLAAAGAFFSRPYHLWADLAFRRDPRIAGLLAQTKALFDPNGILQPHSQALGHAPGYAAQ